MTPYKIISYYTNDEKYSEQISRLKKSIVGYDYYIQRIEPLKTWDDNVNYKPEFILKCLESFGCNILYVDADAVFRSKPVLIDTIDCDIAYRCYPDQELFAGTLYFRNCEKVKKFVRDWIKLIPRLGNVYLAEQTALNLLVRKSTLKVYKLPAQYALIFDTIEEHKPAIIEHFQASRGVKKRGE